MFGVCGREIDSDFSCIFTFISDASTEETKGTTKILEIFGCAGV